MERVTLSNNGVTSTNSKDQLAITRSEDDATTDPKCANNGISTLVLLAMKVMLAIVDHIRNF